MSTIERGLYVTVGAADLAVEKIGDIPAVQKIVERTKQLGEKSVIDRAREFEPKMRERADKLQVRGEKVVERLRKDAKQVREQIQSLPEDARKQLKELPDNARKQATELRERLEKAVGRGNGAVDTVAKPAPKTSAKTS